MRLRALFVAGALAGVLLPTGVATAPAGCAATTAHAALVVDTGSAVDRLCVSIPSGGVTGLGLIQRAKVQYGLDYMFGYNGQAVCRLAGVGSDNQSDCFSEYPYFWGYWHGSESGAWRWSAAGAGSYTVHPGGIEGWSWSKGQDGSSHRPPPATTYGGVCREAPSPEPVPSPSHLKGHNRPQHHAARHRPGHAAGAGTTVPAAAPSPSETAAPSASPEATGPRRSVDRGDRPGHRRHPGRRHRSFPKRERPRPWPATSPPSPPPLAASSSSSDPPVAGIGALAGAGVLAGAGALIARRRMGAR